MHSNAERWNEETQSVGTRKIHYVAQGHVNQVTGIMTNIELLPTLLRSDACEALTWTLPGKGQ